MRKPVGEKFVQKIRDIRNEPDKEKRNALKITLPAVVLCSEPQEIRTANTCTPNGMLMVDCDNIEADQMEAMRQAIMALPYVITTSLSVSGRGLCALIAYEGTPNMKQLLTRSCLPCCCFGEYRGKLQNPNQKKIRTACPCLHRNHREEYRRQKPRVGMLS